LSNLKICSQETLAQNSVAHVQRCADCGCISIHMGPVTVRLDDGSLEALWAALGEAGAELHARRVAQPPRLPHRGVA
jgi:hypothetical protein